MNPAPDSPGRTLLGRYRLIAPAGQGGMAEVWRAEARGAAGFKRPVAIKRVLPHLADHATFREMLIEEARVTALLDHPNIVQVFDVGEDEEGGLFVAMEWVAGVTLRELADHYTEHQVAAEPALVAAIGVELARALEAAHTYRVIGPEGAPVPAPIIHRDVSPSNVLLAARGTVKLADFGLARALDRARMTPDGIVKGKIAYLAPELVRGEDATARSDLYALGGVLWELLVGRRLFADLSDADIVRSLLAGKPHPPVRSVRRDVPRPLARAIDTALAVDPAARHASAAAFGRALRGAARTLRGIAVDDARLAAEVAAVYAGRPVPAADSLTPEPEPSVLDIPVEYSDGEIRPSQLAAPPSVAEGANKPTAVRGMLAR